MPLATLLRATAVKSAAIASAANLSAAIDMHEYTMGQLTMPAAWTAASIGFKVANSTGAAFVPLYDENGTLVQISSPTASNAYLLPPELAACHWVKLWSQDGSGSDTNQAAARTLILDLKA